MRLERGCNLTQRPVLLVVVASCVLFTTMMAESVFITFVIAQVIKRLPVQGVVLSG